MVRLVNEGKSSEISIFEWLDVIEDQRQWDVLTDKENIVGCIAVWRAIGTNNTLGDIALFKAGLAVDGKPSSLVSNLVDTMSIARTAQGLGELDAMKIDWLLALKASDFRELARYCYVNKHTVLEHIKFLRLPQANSYSSQVKRSLFDCIEVGNLNDEDDGWLHRNFLALKTTKQSINFLEGLINKLGKFGYGERCEELVTLSCLPTNKNSHWTRLSHPTKAILKNKYNLSSYFDLYAISSALYSEDAAEALNFTEDQTRQIRSRSMFWSNYSSRFERVRVLLPSTSFLFVAQRNGGVPPFVDDIDETGKLDTEVYIFELGNIIAVEFLRGALSETRFFKNNDWNSQRLLDGEKLTIDEIRAMAQLEVHDHLPSWQYFCEKLLRSKFKVVPNSNIPFFKGLPPDINDYKDGLGLVHSPSEAMIAERRERLESWVEKFWASEVETGKFGELRGLEQKSTLYLSKALMAKQLGNLDDFDFFIKKAANQGNSEAMWQLGRKMLLGRHSDLKWRQAGEDWISQAAAKGHIEATETAQKYGIKFVAHKVAKTQQSEFDVCLASIKSYREFDQQIGLDMIENLGKDEIDEERLSKALHILMSRTKNEKIIQAASKRLQILSIDWS